MGQSGSDSAGDASTIILTNDNSASMINGMEEGCGTFNNVQKLMLHLVYWKNSSDLHSADWPGIRGRTRYL